MHCLPVRVRIIIVAAYNMEVRRIMNGLNKVIIEQIGTYARQYGADKIVLFGSRARGDYGERSDINLAVWGIDKEKQSEFYFLRIKESL